MLAAIPRPQRLTLGLLLALLLLAQIYQPYPAIAPLQHIPTALLLLLSSWLLRRWPLSTPALFSIALFPSLPTLGGRFSSRNVPSYPLPPTPTGPSPLALFAWPP